MFDTETEVVAWIAAKRRQQPWITEVGLVEAAYGAAQAIEEAMARETVVPEGAGRYNNTAYQVGYTNGYEAGYKDGQEIGGTVGYASGFREGVTQGYDAGTGVPKKG